MGNTSCCSIFGSTETDKNVPDTSNQSVLKKNYAKLENEKNLQKPNHMKETEINSVLANSLAQKENIYNEKHPYDDYQMLADLGKGAYGEVSLVKKKKDGKLFAMKVVKKEKVASNLKMIEATLLEQKILKRSNHPFIAKLSQSFQTRGKLYIIMEYMANGDLFSILQKIKKFDENTSRFIFAEVVLGLQNLHEVQKTMYRDLKPENILISEDCHIKLSDFGLAKQFVNKEDKESAFLGTPQYLAPEIVLQKPYDKNVDLWMLGILLFELLNGKPPFGNSGGGQKALMREIVINKPIFPLNFSEEAVDLIKKLLCSTASKRIGSLSFADIKSHKFFNQMSWDQIFEKSLESPLKQYVQKKPTRAYREKTIYETPMNAMNKNQQAEFPEYSYDPNSFPQDADRL